MARRAFSGDITEKAADYHGHAKYVRAQPDLNEKESQSVNIELTFEEAMRLSLAIQSGVLQLNRYNRNTKVGREMGLLLSLKRDSHSISVIEKTVKVNNE